MMPGRASRHVFLGVSAMLVVASAAAAAAWSASMSAMGDMPMAGGWAMSMAWMRMCGQGWPEVAASFLGMWMVMMAAMMLPSLLPALWRYVQAVGRAGNGRRGRLATLAGAGYFLVWIVPGMVVFVLGAALAAAGMQLPMLARAVPIAGCAALLGAGAFQFTAWKAHHLACCRKVPRAGQPMPATAASAWKLGVRLGLHCIANCAGLTAMLLILGAMDLRVMAVVTAAITAERLAPAGLRIDRVIGFVAIGAGLLLGARAAGFG